MCYEFTRGELRKIPFLQRLTFSKLFQKNIAAGLTSTVRFQPNDGTPL